MPEATIKFDLLEEDVEFKWCINGYKTASIIWELDQWLRSEIKHQDKNEYQSVREKLHELIQDEDLTIDSIMGG